MNVADDKHDAFVSAVSAVDLAVRSHGGAETGSGDIECPICQGRIDYRFTRPKRRRIVVRMKCRTAGCFVAMT